MLKSDRKLSILPWISQEFHRIVPDALPFLWTRIVPSDPDPGHLFNPDPEREFIRNQFHRLQSTPKMAGAIHLAVDQPSAGINSLKNDSRIFCDVQLRSLDMPKRKETSICFLVDSGAEISALSAQDFSSSVKNLTKLFPSKIQLFNFDNSKLKKPKGQVNLRISVGGDWINANFQVLSTSCQSVLGAPELKSLQLLIDMASGKI